MGQNIIFGVIAAFAILLFLGLVGLVFSRFYKRATSDEALVRSGSGGIRVIKDGGVLVIPVLHELARINMKTIRLEVRRNGADSLVTQNRLRADVACEFHVRVQAEDGAIRTAARTIGGMTFDEGLLKNEIEGKLVDGLRSVAAKMSMDELHENRVDFVQGVMQAVSDDLKKNGLELEGVSLTTLDQTPFDKLDESNVFNAVGLRNATEVIENARKERQSIEVTAEVEISRRRQQANLEQFEISVNEERARVESATAISKLKADEETAEAMNREAAQRASDTARIEREQATRTSEVMAEQAIALARQSTAIELANKSEEESIARARADEARAKAVTAEESVKTAQATAVAERQKNIEVIEAEAAAQKDATSIRVRASVEREAAKDQAEAVIARAKADAEAIKIAADALREQGLAEAEAIRSRIDAENTLSPEVMAHKERLAKIDALPAILAAMAAPLSHVDSIRIHKFDGMGGMMGGGAGSDGAEGGSSFTDGLFQEVRKNMLAAPVLKKIGDQIGMDFASGIDGVVDSTLNGPAVMLEEPAAAADAPAAPVAPKAAKPRKQPVAEA